ncbi:MAG: hypothetical protein JXA67_02965, partial [Micromonosporaceae bacterium]|nr:hypothetical protein [Micromonosporaceae bacterium]
MSGPFPFTRDDLEADRLLAGARHTLDSFRQWRDDNPGAVASHVDRYTDQLKAITSHRRRPVWPGRRRGYSYRAISRDIAYFVAYNLGEIPDSATVTRIVEALQHRHPSIDDLIAGLGASRQVTGVTDLLGQHLPGLR